MPSRRDGAIQAISEQGLVRWASRYNAFLEMRAAVGDFVTAGQPIIAVFGDASMPANATRRLQGMVALGVERTAEQGAAFAIRIMVDIAIKALSAAINDPTTAIQALDHFAGVLRRLSSLPLHARLAFPDSQGRPRLIAPGRTWEDYLTLAVTRLNGTAAAAFGDSVDHDRSQVSDPQGIGGPGMRSGPGG